MWRFAVTSAIDVGFHHVASAINIVTINTGAMFLILTDDFKATDGRAVAFAAT